MPPTELWLKPRVDAETARRRMERWCGGWTGMLLSALRKLRRNHAGPGLFQPLKFELVYLPHAVVVLKDSQSESRSTDGVLLVNGFARTVEVATLDDLQTEPQPPDRVEFAYPLNETETLRLANERLLQLRLSRAVRAPKDARLPLRLDRLLHWPYWVMHFRTVGRRVDFRMMDALTGERAEGARRTAFLQALETKARTKDGREPQGV